ncbi:sensor histidine kinase [Paratissierella segnis]|jgi:signal transduction histidine kinase|uniref:histidine kinase n=1 Tax=Paratissierella segnis TaxID=2763679 RepID=A0A926IJA0_9FIRM|nr:HAMP domain-containing sensor histidine kinase [Paratissierella segnis]MBC8587804.1 HAMP domain-containing histidine kinase [Paratissierella segnis]
MDKLKLQWKIFAFLLGFCVLLISILWIFQTTFLSDMYKFTRKIEINKAINLVEKEINSPNLKDILYELEFTKEIIVQPTQDFNPPARPAHPDKNNHRQPETITRTQEYTLEDGRNISLTFYAMVTPVDATVSTLRMQLVIITVIMVLLAIMLAVIISKHISKPIEKINQSAKLMAEGNYEIEFHGKGFLEIEELSDTLNTAAVGLSKVERLRRELMANVSHDLRTPLALIYSYAEMMHDFPQEATLEHSQIIMDETKRLTCLVNDMLDISNIEKGMEGLNRINYNLTESLEKTIKRISEFIKKDGYRFDFIYDKYVYIIADEVKITQVFYNLLINAVTHCGNDKIIIIKQIIKDNKVRIEIIDHGEGISEDNLPYIWDRYYKVDKNHKRPVMGTGLGLSIVKKIIAMHNGEYGVKSVVGKGSTFWFELDIIE